MESVSANRLSRKNQRGVSPIIATILLVAITVVLAAVLYILVTGLLGGHTSVTSAISMTANTGGSCTTTTPAGGAYTTFSISVGGATSTVTTSNFGLSFTAAGANTATPTGTLVTTVAGSTCPAGVTGAVPPAAGWSAVLIAPGGSSVSAVYGTVSGTAGWYQPSGSALGAAVQVQGGQTIVIITPTSGGVNLVGASVGVFGTNGATVTGSVTL